jgi:hypothetical protein
MPSPQLDSEIGFATFSAAAKLYMFSSVFSSPKVVLAPF